ncbi:MAG TPA: DUF3987 domain-containing protein [Coleofasciculaceae cyanobacterium]|jgi:hypothetical protein
MTTFQSVHSVSKTQKLIDGLKRIIATDLDLPLVPIGNNKQPLGDRWQQRPFTASQLIEAINQGGVSVPIQGKTKKIHPLGFGLITGRCVTIEGNSHFLMALDQDGGSACRKIDELSEGRSLPNTVAFTSDRPGRCQYLFLIPEQYAHAIKTKKIKTGVIGDDGKAEQLEFRWQSLQSVLPPSVHPTTGEYRWVDGCAIDETEVAIAPNWIIEQMLIEPVKQKAGEKRKVTAFFTPSPMHVRWTDTDFALSYLDAVSSYRASDYDEWLNVGMALHSIDDTLLDAWDKWSNQSAKYKPGECERKWRSFSSGGGVTLGTLAHMAKQDGWQSPFASQNKNTGGRDRHNFQKSQTKNATVTGDTQPNGDTSKLELLGFDATVTTVTDVLKAGLIDYAERDRLDCLQARSVISKAAFWQMVAAIRTNLDEIQPEDTAKFERLIDWHNATLNFEKVLPQPLADAFKRDAAILNIDPVSLWQYFLPTVLSLAGKRVNLDLESHSIPAIAWTCIVGESGTGKSRAESVILANLKQKQHLEKKRWLEEMQEYKQICQSKSKNDDLEIEPPIPERKYLFEVATIQAVMRRLSEQHDNGSIWARDEIAGLFKSLGQFQGKKGDNEGLECLLKMWDGSGSFVDRVNAENDSYAVSETRLSIAGGIQPGAFRTAFKDPDDAQGLQARFLYAIPQVFPAKRVRGYCELSDILPPLYDWLDRCPTGKIKLSPTADRRYSNLVEQIGLQAEQSTSGAVRAWMRKLPTQLLRIALGLHLIECYYNSARYEGELQLATLERAVEVCRYYRSTFALVREKTADSDNISSILLKMWDLATVQPDGVTPRELYRGIKAIGRRAQQIGRGIGAYTIELINQLVQMGKGTLEKNGRSFRFFAKLDTQNNSGSSFRKINEIDTTTQKHGDAENDFGFPSKTIQQPERVNDSISSVCATQNKNDSTSTSFFDLDKDELFSVGKKPAKTTELKEEENTKSLPEPSLRKLINKRDSNSNYSESATDVTKAKNYQQQELEPSSTIDMSPVTTKYEQSQFVHQNEANEQNKPAIISYFQEQNVAISANVLDTNSVEKSECNSDKSYPYLEQKQNLNWLLQFLADLESIPMPHRRFTSLEQLENLFNELERRATNCYKELLEKCPNYMERLASAQKIVSECFPLSS